MTEMELGRDRLRRIVRVIDVRCCYSTGKILRRKSIYSNNAVNE